MLSFAKSLKNLLGVGPHLILIGLLLEGLTMVVQQWVSFPIPLDVNIKIILTIPFVIACLLGMMWFNRSLNLIKVNLSNGESKLITKGPFSYVRHPLYSTLIIMLPPLVVVWLADLLFLIPWVLIIFISHFVVSIEEKGLIKAFGEDYEKYRRYVPALLPYKGSAGKCYQGD